MAFVFRKDPAFDWPVTIREPQKGRKVSVAVNATFRVLPMTRVGELIERARDSAQKRGEVFGAGEAEMEILREVLMDWKDILDEDKTPLLFSDESREQLLAIPYVRSAFLEGYLDAISGQAKRGN